MKTLYILIIGLLVSSAIMAQSCLPEGITFETQAQIDSFQIMYPNCTEIEGDVIIGLANTDITNLNGLSVLTYIEGSIHINRNYNLTNLTGLGNVTYIGGDLRIFDHPALTSLSGLDNLTYIGGFLEIRATNHLTSLTGLDNVTYIGGDLFINANDALISLTGLYKLTSIGENLIILGNHTLIDLTGLDNLTTIFGNLQINHNDALISLTGLDNVTSIGGDLIIGDYLSGTGNQSLTSLTGLSSLTSIAGNLEIYANDPLTSLSGLENIDAASIDDLIVILNDSLSSCDILSICDYLISPGGTIQINNNATGCNTQEEVEEACVAGLDESGNSENHLIIYPNPSSTQITIELPTTPQKNTSLTIYNLNGQQLITQAITEPQTVVDISMLPSGVYFVKVVDDEKVMVQKVIKQ